MNFVWEFFIVGLLLVIINILIDLTNITTTRIIKL